jgi:hypothetical protein
LHGERCVRGSARVFNPNPPRVPQDACQASDLIAFVVPALMMANLLLMALSS